MKPDSNKSGFMVKFTYIDKFNQKKWIRNFHECFRAETYVK
jgi:hypothetical protein